MQTIVRILMILAASLLITGITYAVGQTEWGSMERDGPPGEGAPPRGARPNFHAAAEILGIAEDDLMSALDGFPPNIDAASETLDIPVAQIEAAMEEAGTEEGHGERGAEPFNARSLFAFGETLIPIALIIALFTWVPKGIEAIQQRTTKSSAH